MLLADFDTLGEVRVIAHPHAIPPLETVDPGRIYLWWSVLLRTTATLQDIEEMLIFFLDGHDLQIHTLSAPPPAPENQAELDGALSPAPLGGTAANAAKPTTPAGGLVAPPTTAQTTEKIPSREADTIRVNIQKLDTLINLVGEAVILHARMSRSQREVSELNEEVGERLLHILDDHDRVIQELRNHVMKVRMVPIRGAFLPLSRMVRDYSRNSGKQIQLITRGEETEIDKTIIEKLSGPLKHMIRNAMDHGIEFPEARRAQGKAPLGTITLQATNQRGSIFVVIEDDGAGIDTAKVLASAHKKGLVPEDQTPSEQEIFQLLFSPGFSTTERVSDISGRGVGMDVVRQEIETLHGTIDVRSTVGQGSQFCLKLPLTLAIIEGMLVRVANQEFTIPLLTIVESLQPHAQQIKTLKGQGELIMVRNEYIPLLHLHRVFGLKGAKTRPSDGLVVIVEDSGNKCCLLVDEIIDQQQVVIKSLEDNLMPVAGLAGATILGDGRISLILDIPNLLQCHTVLDVVG